MENTWKCISHDSNINTRESIKTCCLPIITITVGRFTGYLPSVIWWCDAGSPEEPSLAPSSSSSSLQPSRASRGTPGSHVWAEGTEQNLLLLASCGECGNCCCSTVFLTIVEIFFCLNSALERVGKREYLVKVVCVPWA